jgi:hypothetical protein
MLKTVLTIGVVMDLLRRGARRSNERADQLMADTHRREMEAMQGEAGRRNEILQRERANTQARMHMALQGRGIYAYGDPTGAAYISQAAAQNVPRGSF